MRLWPLSPRARSSAAVVFKLSEFGSNLLKLMASLLLEMNAAEEARGLLDLCAGSKSDFISE